MSEKRMYTKISILREEILQMRENGSTHSEIANHFGFKDKYVVKEFLKRERRKQEKLASGVELRPKGRPTKGWCKSEAEKDYEIKRLQMENKLLRDFLQLTGRR